MKTLVLQKVERNLCYKSFAGQELCKIEELDSKIDMLSKLVSKSLNELDDCKENLTSIDSKKELDFKDRLIECEKLILPLLQKLDEE